MGLTGPLGPTEAYSLLIPPEKQQNNFFPDSILTIPLHICPLQTYLFLYQQRSHSWRIHKVQDWSDSGRWFKVLLLLSKALNITVDQESSQNGRRGHSFQVAGSEVRGVLAPGSRNVEHNSTNASAVHITFSNVSDTNGISSGISKEMHLQPLLVILSLECRSSAQQFWQGSMVYWGKGGPISLG